MSPERNTESREVLVLDLSFAGADLNRLGFIKWLRDHGRDPEWVTPADKPPSAPVLNSPLYQALRNV